MVWSVNPEGARGVSEHRDGFADGCQAPGSGFRAIRTAEKCMRGIETGSGLTRVAKDVIGMDPNRGGTRES